MDITGPKVLTPAILFALLSPGLLLRVGPNPLIVHALVLSLVYYLVATLDRKSTRLNSSHSQQSRMPSSA